MLNIRLVIVNVVSLTRENWSFVIDDDHSDKRGGWMSIGD